MDFMSILYRLPAVYGCRQWPSGEAAVYIDSDGTVSGVSHTSHTSRWKLFWSAQIKLRWVFFVKHKNVNMWMWIIIINEIYKSDLISVWCLSSMCIFTKSSLINLIVWYVDVSTKVVFWLSINMQIRYISVIILSRMLLLTDFKSSSRSYCRNVVHY